MNDFMNDRVIKLFGGDDPRIAVLTQDIKNLIYKRSVGIFQLATVLGILDMAKYEIIKEMEED